MKPSVYIETSVVSYYVSRPSNNPIVASHQQTTRDWWSRILPRCEPHISPFVISEIEQGDSSAAKSRLEAVREMTLLPVTDEVKELAQLYSEVINIPETAKADSYHLALSAFHGMDYLLTWNCTHIAAARVRFLVEQVNAERQIQTPIICTPEEFMEI